MSTLISGCVPIKDLAGIEHADITPELLVHTGPDLIGLGIQKVLDN